jgi:hypothetical protein
VTFPDHDGIVAIPAVTLPDNFTIAIAISIPIMAGSDGHAARTDTDPNLFRASRHCDANSGHRDGYYCKTPDHRMLLGFVNYRRGKSRWLEWFRPRSIGEAEASQLYRKPDRYRDDG